MATKTTIRDTDNSKVELTVGAYSSILLENRGGRAIIHPVTKAGAVRSHTHPPLTTQERGKIFNAVNEKKP